MSAIYLTIYFYLIYAPYKFSTGYISPTLITVNQDIDFYIGNSELLLNNPLNIIDSLYEWYSGKKENLIFFMAHYYPY